MSSTQDLGLVTAYGYAVEGGYTGTEAEFKTLLGQQQTYHDEAVQAAEDAEAYAAQAMSGTPDGYASLVSTVNSLNSALTVTTKDYTCSIDGISGTATVKKYGRLCVATGLLIGSFANVTTGTILFAITDAGYKPLASTYTPLLGRDVGAGGNWASASYYPVTSVASTSGNVTINGSTANIQSIGYLPFVIVYISAS